MILLADKTISPALLIQERIDVLRQRHSLATSSASDADVFALAFSHEQYYLPEKPPLNLIALIYAQLDQPGVARIEGSIFPFSLELSRELQTLADDYSILRQYCRNRAFPWIQFNAPWLLSPIQIPKPWGCELWFTGIEVRGQSEVCCDGGNLPLPWLLSLFPQVERNNKEEVILLKVLDPLPDDVYGDLYLELHEQKQEVYVVTHVDPIAWPDGTGAIQLGFNQGVRNSFANDELFKQAYVEAVKQYEVVRRSLDAILEQKKATTNIAADQPVAMQLLKEWMKELSQESEIKELMDKEAELLNCMNSFIEMYPLRVGDWIKVPRYMPHSLQHGVRVVEFQTPVYERKILSFAQQVLTQPHWDTDAAMTLATLGAYQADAVAERETSTSSCIESIASFDDFDVRRIALNDALLLDAKQYSLLMVLQGEISVELGDTPTPITSGQAVLLPAMSGGWVIKSVAPSLLLHALPSNSSPK